MSDATQHLLRQPSHSVAVRGLGSVPRIVLALYSIALIVVLDLYLARSLLPFSPLTLETALAALLVIVVPFPALGKYSGVAAAFILIGFMAGLCSSLFNIESFGRTPFDAILASALLAVVFTFWWINSVIIDRYSLKIAVVSLWVLFLSVVADVVSPGIFTNSLFRPAGFPANPNITALLCALLLSIILYHPESGRLMRFGCVMAGVTITAFSASRFGILALLLTILVYFVFRATVAERLALLVSFLVAVAFFTFVRDGTFLAQSANISNRLDLGSSLFDAYEIRSQVLFEYLRSTMSCNPVFGCGYAVYEQQEVHGHNTLVNTFFKGGLLQLAAVVGFIITVLAACVAISRPKELTIAAILGGALFVHNDLFAYPLVAFCIVSILRSADAVAASKGHGLGQGSK